ncbi:MAG: apolipoprotein N-acyltransferase [Paracoccaceae bacterium]
MTRIKWAMTEIVVEKHLATAPRLALAALGGAVGALAHAPFDWSILVLVPLAVGFFMASQNRSRLDAFFTGWAIGVGYFALTLRWIVEPFQVDAAVHGWMAPFALFFLAAGLALFWGLAFLLAFRRGAIALAVFWTLVELGRAYVFTGFPWGNFAQTLLDTPFQSLLPIIGPQGLTFALLLFVALLFGGWARACLGIGLCLGLGATLYFAPKPPVRMTDKTVRIVQPNAPQHEKWHPEKGPEFVRRQLSFTEAPGQVDLVLWPETAIPYLFSNAEIIFEFAAQSSRGVPVVMGVQRDDDQGRYYNSAVLLDEVGAVRQIYDKHHLVPFGEYMPLPKLFQRLGIAALAERSDGGYTPGPGPQLMELGSLGLALPLICYEAVFPQDLRGTGRPDFLMQLTNDAWFGVDAGPEQHLAQARMRSIEQGLPMARAANTGISAMIGPYGQVLDSLPLDEAGFVDALLPMPLSATVYSRTGDWPASGMILLASILVLLRPFLARRDESD